MRAIRHERERQFVEKYFDHDEWVYEPITFNIGETKRIRYTPDFYDKKNDAYIEVVGTRQAFYANNAKYQLFREAYPHIKLLVLDVDGNPFEIKKKRETAARKRRAPSGDETVADNIYRIRVRHNLTQKQFAAMIGKTCGAVAQWETGRNNPSTSTILKISSIFNVSPGDFFQEHAI